MVEPSFSNPHHRSLFSNRIGWWKLLLALFLALILGRFMVAGLAKVLFNTQSSDGDESAYLALGLDLREQGILSDGTRPPLYPLLLAPVAGRDWSYFTWAKLITLSLGAGAVLVTFIVGQSLFNWKTGLLAAFLLAMNKEFHLRASTIYADTLLVLLFVAAWYFLIKSFEARRYGYWAGFFVGLAYLTKSSATLLLLAWGLVALVYYRRRILAQKQLLIVPLTFLITTSPLLIYNWRNFGSPFYNFATSHVMWMDRWAESQVEDRMDLPTVASYFQTHTLVDIFDRLRVGLERLNPELMTTLIPSRTLEPAWLGPVGLAGLLFLSGWLLLYRRAWLKERYIRYQLLIQMSLFLFLLFYLFSAWYARVLIESRFLIPILGPFYLLVAAVASGGVSYLRAWLLDGAPAQAAGEGLWGRVTSGGLFY
jgi:4-amino-4-deoxy-L-arabinose transferase-like glycosyltransferase